MKVFLERLYGFALGMYFAVFLLWMHGPVSGAQVSQYRVWSIVAFFGTALMIIAIEWYSRRRAAAVDQDGTVLHG